VRTTLTIDDDVAKLVEQEVKRTGDSFKGTVNQLLREGVTARRNPQPRERFVVTPHSLGIGELLDRHNGKVSALIEELEGPFYR
jgi:hypothetical protein